MILAGDIGGTKTVLGLFPFADSCVPIVESTFQTRDYVSFEALLDDFLKNHTFSLKAACFGVAAPVINGRTEPVNLPWIIDQDSVTHRLALKDVWLMNDMEATAYGIETLPQERLAILQEGRPAPKTHQCVIAAGTSLGEVTLLWGEEGYRALASEGGHADYAPQTALEFKLVEELKKMHSHVSYARIVSGPGLESIYRFLRRSTTQGEPRWLSEALANSDPAEVISSTALNGQSRLCEQALDLFVSVFAAEAGNLALRNMPCGVVSIGGGIAPKILPKLREAAFLNSFRNKGRLEHFLRTVRVQVILEPKTALYGAAQRAKELLTSLKAVCET